MKSRIFLNRDEIEVITFPGGEVQIVLEDNINFYENSNSITAHIKDSDGLLALGQLKDFLDVNCFTDISLRLPYLPYARYDRRMQLNDSLSLKVFTNFINSLNFAHVAISDCHSDVGVALLNNCSNREQHKMVDGLVEELSKYSAIVSPDAGASKKAFKLASILDVPLIECSKKRDIKTGKITEFTVPESALDYKTVLVADDLCDGGGTFLALGEQFKHCKQIDLYVSHGIFSRGTRELSKIYDNIYAYYCWEKDIKVTYNTLF